MKLTVTSTLAASPETVWRLLQYSSTLVYLTKGLMSFTAANQFPQRWQKKKPEPTNLLLFGCIPAGSYQLEFTRIDKWAKEMETIESGGVISKWSHTMRVQKIGEESTLYTDELSIEAGLLTWLVVFYAHVFYRYRHWRWKQLLEVVE